MEEFDLIVIGGGPGGYVAAIRGAQLGMKVACIESRGALGGTCLNVGCIPSKALLQSSEMFNQINHHADEHGIGVSKVELNLDKMMERKRGIVDGMTKGIEGLFKKNKVTYLRGHGSFVDPHTVSVDGGESYKAKHIVIATGSNPIELKSIAPFDEDKIVSSTGALSFEKVPNTLAVIGGGVIGLELGSVWARLGAKVTVVEAAPEILAQMDKDVSREMTRVLKKQGLEILVGTKLQSAKTLKSKVKLSCLKGDEAVDIEAEKVLVCVGRMPNTSGLNCEAAGVELDERGRVAVDDHLKTNVSHIYAIGDVIKGPMLAHKAEDEGIAVAETVAGQAGHVNYDAIPSVIYTWPEVASVGKTEQELKAAGVDVKVGKFPFKANGRARCFGETSGFVKIIADGATDRVLGVHIVGPNASELIGEVVVAVEYQSSSEDIARCVHAHPTLAEAIKEAALAVDKRTIHI